MASASKIITGVDKLLKLVDEQNELTLTQASNMLEIDKEVVSTWANILDDGNMIVVQDNLREKIFVSKNWHESKPFQPVSTVFNKVKHFVVKPKRFNEEALQQKYRELRAAEIKHKKRETMLETKQKELRACEEKAQYAEQKIGEANERIAECERKEDFLRQAQRRFLEEQKGLEKMQTAFEQRIERMGQKETMLRTLEKDLAIQERLLADQRSVIENRQRELDQKESALHSAAQQVHKILL